MALAAVLLEQAGINVDAKDTNCQTALSVAAENSDGAIVRFFLSGEDIDIFSQDDTGRTAYSWAMEEGHWTVMQLLA